MCSASLDTSCPVPAQQEGVSISISSLECHRGAADGEEFAASQGSAGVTLEEILAPAAA